MTPDELALLRDWIQEPTSEAWNDDRLQKMYELQGNDLRATAAAFWKIKAAASASLVDVSENGSSRKLSDIHKNYKAMEERFLAEIASETIDVSGRPRTRAIVRP